METLMWLLINVAVLYLMIHYGGCGHSAKSKHDLHGSSNNAAFLERPVFRDPVCGMAVAAADGYTRAHIAHEYHFCSRTCRMLFEQNPDRYLIEKRMAS
jgi:YHS domain-containing protein